jgi:hypothetical protein
MTHNNDLLFLAGNREWAGLVGLGAEHRGDRTYGAGPDGPPAPGTYSPDLRPARPPPRRTLPSARLKT